MRRLERAGALSWQLVGVGVAAAAAMWLLVQLKLVVIPLVLGLLLATLTSGLVDRLERLRVRRSIGAAVVVVSGTVAVTAAVAATLPRLVREIQALLPKVRSGAGTVLDWLQTLLPTADFGSARGVIEDPVGGLNADFWALGSQALPLVGAVGEVLAMASLTLVFWFFLARDAGMFGRALLGALPAGERDRAGRAMHDGWHMLRRFLLGTSLVAAVDAVGIGVGLLVLGVPAAGALTLLVFLGGFIPVVGATVTGVLAVLVALASGGPTLALTVAAVVLAVQQLESNVLQPLVMRRAVQLHPMVTLAALAAGATTVGLLGAFLAVPVAAVVVAVARVYRPRSA
jgi:predicted PurR-regulated permease PerM